MEKNRDRLYRNRYAYRDNTRYEWELRQGASARRLQKYWENGILTGQMLYLMEALSEMSVFSAKQIESFFWLDWMPECFNLIRSADGKNAYRGLIRKMEEYGILVPGKMVNGENTVGSKVYALSSGALQVIREYRGTKKACVSKWMEQGYNTDFRLGSSLDYELTLQILSLNQFHLHLLKTAGRAFGSYGRIWLEPELPANIYCRENENLLILSARGGAGCYRRYRQCIEKARQFCQIHFRIPEHIRIVVIAEDLNWPIELHMELPDENRFNLVYTTDQEVFEGNAVHRYIEVTGPGSYRFTD